MIIFSQCLPLKDNLKIIHVGGTNGKGSTRWRDSVYIPSGNGIYKYINGNNSAVVTIVGPDKDDGLPSDKRGAIRTMTGSHNELLIGVDAQTGADPVSYDAVSRQWQSHFGSPVMANDTGKSAILGYNELGWEVKWLASDTGTTFDTMHVSTAYNKYRLWWGANGVVYFMDLPKDIINPSEVDDFPYATSGVHETPWFNAGQSEVDKLALNLKIECQDLSSNETVVVQYATDYSESYTTAVTLNSTTMGASAGTYTYTFGSNAGVSYRSIKFKLTLSRSTATTTGLEKYNTPDVISTTLTWRKKLQAKWGHTVEVDLNNVYKGNKPIDLRKKLVEAIESETLVEFTFRDDSGGTRNYYVDVTSAQGLEFTGRDERGSTMISVVEPQEIYMRTVFGVTNVSSAGTAVQLNNATNRVKYIKVKALAGNSGIAYVGASDVSATANSYELSATNELELNFGEFGGSVPANVFYAASASNNDKVCWTMVLEG